MNKIKTRIDSLGTAEAGSGLPGAGQVSAASILSGQILLWVGHVWSLRAMTKDVLEKDISTMPLQHHAPTVQLGRMKSDTS